MTVFRICSFLLTLFVAINLAIAQNSEQSQSSATAVAKASFAALKAGDIPKFVSFFHPSEFERFKTFANRVAQQNSPDAADKQILALLAPHDSSSGIQKSRGDELLIAFLENTFKQQPDLKETLEQLELQILGEITETPEKIHVITRLAIRPQPVSCQLHDGKWYQLLNQETMQLINTFDRKEFLRHKNLKVDDVTKNLSMDEIQVIGHVMDGKDTAQVLCRVTMKMDDFSYPVLGCYPVRENEPAWSHLGDTDKSALTAALRKKWSR